MCSDESDVEVWGRRFVQEKVKLDSRKQFVAFFSERTSCNCLADETEAVQDDSTGMCYCCRKTAEDTTLFDCKGCYLFKYCGSECQLEHWKNGHKNFCKKNQCDSAKAAQK